MAVNGGHAGTKKGPNWGHVSENTRLKKTDTLACRNARVRFENTSVSKWVLDLLNNGRQRVGAF